MARIITKICKINEFESIQDCTLFLTEHIINQINKYINLSINELDLKSNGTITVTECHK